MSEQDKLDQRKIDAGVKCYDCDMPYEKFPLDVIMPDELWEQINPSLHKGGGILCATCIWKRLALQTNQCAMYVVSEKDYTRLVQEQSLRARIEGLREKYKDRENVEWALESSGGIAVCRQIAQDLQSLLDGEKSNPERQVE